MPALSHADLGHYIDLAVPEADRDVVRSILTSLTPGSRLTLRHIRRLAKRLQGSESERFLN